MQRTVLPLMARPPDREGDLQHDIVAKQVAAAFSTAQCCNHICTLSLSTHPKPIK